MYRNEWNVIATICENTRTHTSGTGNTASRTRHTKLESDSEIGVANMCPEINVQSEKNPKNMMICKHGHYYFIISFFFLSCVIKSIKLE